MMEVHVYKKHWKRGQTEVWKRRKSAFQLFKRFLDNLFQIFNGTSKQLHQLYEEINKIHQTLKFTMEHTSPKNLPEEDRCNCERKNAIPF